MVTAPAQSGSAGSADSGSPDPSPEQDLILMQRVAADDEQAIGDLYDRFAPLVYRMAYQPMPSRTDAEDVVQEVFLRLWRTADRFDPKRRSSGFSRRDRI